MLGRLRMSIDECIDAYLSLSDQVFQKKAHRVMINGRVQGRFDSEELKQAVKDVVTKRGLDEDALLKDTSDGSCKVYGLVPHLESLLLTDTDPCARQANKQVIPYAS